MTSSRNDEIIHINQQENHTGGRLVKEERIVKLTLCEREHKSSTKLLKPSPMSLFKSIQRMSKFTNINIRRRKQYYREVSCRFPLCDHREETHSSYPFDAMAKIEKQQ